MVGPNGLWTVRSLRKPGRAKFAKEDEFNVGGAIARRLLGVVTDVDNVAEGGRRKPRGEPICTGVSKCGPVSVGKGLLNSKSASCSSCVIDIFRFLVSEEACESFPDMIVRLGTRR